MLTALVTGASSGIGAALVSELVARGYRVVAVVRRPEAVDALVAAHGEAVTGLVADLATVAGIAAVETAVAARPPALLVNNAATGRLGPLEDQDPDDLTALTTVNVLAPLRLTAAAVRSGVAGVVNVSSTASTDALPLNAPYVASKAFLDSLSASLRRRPGATTITLVRPGYVRTAFHHRLGEDVSAVPAHLWQTPADVARRLLDAHARGAGRVTLDVPGRRRRLVRRRAVGLARRVVEALARLAR